jgi:hypothetical protein
VWRPREPDRSRMGPMADTGGGDERSTTTREQCRAPRRPRGHRQSTWDRNDRAMVARRTHAGTPRSTTTRDAASRSCRRGRSSCHLADQTGQTLLELVECMFVRASIRADEQESRGHIAVAKHGPQPSAQPIALDGRPGGATDGEGHLRWNHLGIGNERAPERIDPHTDAVSPEAKECVAFANPVDQADRRARPLARRDFSTARPARVLMRARKPCLRARRRLLG